MIMLQPPAVTGLVVLPQQWKSKITNLFYKSITTHQLFLLLLPISSILK